MPLSTVWHDFLAETARTPMPSIKNLIGYNFMYPKSIAPTLCNRFTQDKECTNRDDRLDSDRASPKPE